MISLNRKEEWERGREGGSEGGREGGRWCWGMCWVTMYLRLFDFWRLCETHHL